MEARTTIRLRYEVTPLSHEEDDLPIRRLTRTCYHSKEALRILIDDMTAAYPEDKLLVDEYEVIDDA